MFYSGGMSNKVLAAVLAVLVIALAVWAYYFYGGTTTAPEKTTETEPFVPSEATTSVTENILPAIEAQSNPLQDVPDVNPAEKSNPFSNVKTNPFR